MVQASIGFQASPPLGLRVEQSDLERCAPRSAGRAGTTSKTADGSVRPTSRTSCGCGPRTTSTGSASAVRPGTGRSGVTVR